MRVPLAAPLLFSAWIGALALEEHRLNDALASLPAPLQAQMYHRSYDELATICASQPILADHCRDEAALLVRFPQCDADCAALARRFVSGATR